VDGDGDLDLACGNNDQANMLYLNDGGNLATTPAWGSGPTNLTRGVAWGDVDGDGDLDLVCGNDRQSNTLYLNDGGTLATTSVWNSERENATRSVAWGDVDGDGDLDLACGNNDQANMLYLNLNDGGTLATAPAWRSGRTNRTWSVAWGDVDGDGDLDLVCGNWNQVNTLYRNTVRFPLKTQLTHHLPNNSAFLRSVTVGEAPDSLFLSFDAVDLESDFVWVVPEYKHEGSSDWHPVQLTDGRTRAGPLPSSVAGTPHELVWDVSHLSYDPRDVILRLRTVSHPTRAGTIQQVSAYHVNVGRPGITRAQIALRDTSVSFPQVTVFDTTSVTLELLNLGIEPLEVQNVVFPSPDMWTVPSVPFQVASQSRILTLGFSPREQTEVTGDLWIETNDAVTPVLTVAVSAPIRPIGFKVAVPDTAFQDMPFEVCVTMDTLFVQADSVFVCYRRGGGSENSRIRLRPETSDEVGPNQWVGAIPGESVSVAGLIYQVELYKGTLGFLDPEKRARVRVFDLTFPKPIPKRTYVMFSFPLETLGSAVDILRDDFGNVVGSDWRLFSWSAADSNYLEADKGLPPDLEQGRAYWFVSQDADTIDLERGTGLSTPTGGPFTRVLLRGWNQVGNPFAFRVGWSDILAASGTNADSVEIQRFTPNSENEKKYSLDVGVLEPFEGYWVKNHTNEPMSLQVPPVEWTGPTPAGSLSLSDVEDDGWRVQIAASVKGFRDHWNVIGVSATASTGRDSWDRSDPPLSPGPSLSGYFPKPGRDRLRVDIRPASESGIDEYRWAFDVAKNFSRSESADLVTLDFSGMETVPSESEVVFQDLMLGHELDLREEPQYTFFLGEKGYVTEDKARFLLLVGSEEYVHAQRDILPPPSKTLLRQSYPNPFRAGTVIRYELADPGTAEIHIFDVRGQLIRKFVSEHAQPGRYEAAWYGDNEQGRSVAPGVYFYRLKTSGYTEARKIIRIK
jgi:hypothetical protein